MKNHCPRDEKAAVNHRLAWVGHVAGKRESRRLIGDYVLTENDIRQQTLFPDRVAYGGWTLDDHHSGGFFHQGSFGDLADEEVDDLACVLIRTFTALRRACGDPDFNLVLYSAPTNGHTDEVFHWHIKIIPKLATPAGFEIGSAMSINTVLPEDAAEALRRAHGG